MTTSLTPQPEPQTATLVPQNFRCAQVAILGRPNAGKSTLLNSLLEVSISAVSKRPQTTRTALRGIIQLYSKPPVKAAKTKLAKGETPAKGDWNGQIVLVDTPGVNFKKGLLDRSMHMAVEGALRDVDIVLWVADCRGFARDLRDIEMGRPGADKLAGWLKDRLSKKDASTRWILVLSKADMVSKNELLPLIQKASELLPEITDVVPVAAMAGMKDTSSNLDNLLAVLREAAPLSAPVFSEEDWTDLNDKQLLQNLIREAIFRQTEEEVPYQCDCTILRYQEPDGAKRKMPEVDATIWVAKDSLKRIVVGAGGSRVKEIGMKVRERYKEITGDNIVLRLFIKVVDKWDSRAANLSELGYVLD
jgi:GTP-binding protein Era